MSTSTLEREGFSVFQPVENNRFRFVAKTYNDFGPEEQFAAINGEQETVRMAWLEQYLSMHNMCSKGYDISERKVTLRSAGIVKGYNVFYNGFCR